MAKTQADPTAAAARWAQQLSAAAGKITASVNAVSVAPGAQAAAQKNVWLANVTAAADRWAHAVGAVSLQAWQQAMIQKGIPRVQSGASQAQPKVQAFLSQWIPYEAQLVAQLPPRGSLEQNITRMTQLVRENAAAKGKFRQSGRSR